ncbi:MAG: ribonuclease P protein component [Ginsengibacter sp.]
MIQKRFTLKSIEKLKSSKIIRQIFEEGKSFSHFPFRIIYISLEKNQSHLQAAFAVSTKNFKKAVDRNRIKRLMRETYRLQKGTLQSLLEINEKYLAAFIIYTGKELPVYDMVLTKMGSLLEQLNRIVEYGPTNKQE